MSGLFAALKELERKFGLPERPIKINFSSVPVPDDKAESNHAPRDHSPRANDSIGEGARVGATEKPLTGLQGSDTLGAAGNILSGSDREFTQAGIRSQRIIDCGGSVPPAQDPFTPALFRAMIRQQCLGEAR